MNKLFSCLMALSLLVSVVSEACLHYPNNFKGRLREGLQEAFLYHDGQNAHLAIRTNLNADKFPKEIAWVLPFPSVPSKYEEINGPFFERLRELFPGTADGQIGSSKGVAMNEGARGAAPMIKVHQRVDVGSYQIQPIEILDENGGNELSQWLKKNKFNPMPENLQKPYLKKGAAFLAIRMQMDNPGGELRSKSLHVTYQADDLSLPIRFTHETRTFDLDLYVFSTKELKKDMNDYHLKRIDSVAYKNQGYMPFVDTVIGKRSGYFTLYQARDLNKGSKKLTKLDSDPSFKIAEL